MLGSIRRICRVASRPFSSGMTTSMTIMSGFHRSAPSTAIRPLSASPQISMSGSEFSIDVTPRRTSAWSSAIITRLTFIIGSLIKATLKKGFPQR